MLDHQAAEFAQYAYSLNRPTPNAAIARAAAVARLVGQYSRDEVVIAAAWLHDVVDTTPVSLADISRQFGMAVANLTHELSGITDFEHTAGLQVATNICRLALISANAQSIALASLVCRVRAQPELDERFLQRQREALAVLTRGHPGLIALARLALSQKAGAAGDTALMAAVG